MDFKFKFAPNYKEYLQKSDNYFELLTSVKVLFDNLRSYLSSKKSGHEPLVGDLIDYTLLLRRANHKLINHLKIIQGIDDHIEGGGFNNANSVTLITAHSAKGLEYRHVFVAGLNKNLWEKDNSRSTIALPKNLNIKSESSDSGDFIRLFFVAITRAKANLYLTRFRFDGGGKDQIPISFLDFSNIKNNTPIFPLKIESMIEGLVLRKNNFKLTKNDILSDILSRYQLSITHINNFVNVTGFSETDRGGPKKFLEMNLLQFPQSKPNKSRFGTAVHEVLNLYLQNENYKNENYDIAKVFKNSLQNALITGGEFDMYFDLGVKSLSYYLNSNSLNLSKTIKTEVDFSTQNVFVGNAKLTGKIDLMEIDRGLSNIFVVDFKTGTHLERWDKLSGHKLIKADNYKRQLDFYKILVENSRDFGFGKYSINSGSLDFVQIPAIRTQLEPRLSLDLNQFDGDKLKVLIEKIWVKIMSLDFPDTSFYENSHAGSQNFIDDLINGKI